MSEKGLLRIKLVRATDLVPADSNGCAIRSTSYLTPPLMVLELLFIYLF